MMRLQKTILPGVILLIAFSACAPQTTPTQEIAPSVTPGPSPTIDLMATVTAIRSVPTSTRTRIPSPTRAPTATHTPTPTATPTSLFTFQEATPIYLGTPLPADGEPIGAGNISRLVHAAQWGKGAIRAAAFAPDGRSFVVGSATGLAVYNMSDLTNPPTWLPFAQINSYYESISFSADRNYILLEGRGTQQIMTFPENKDVQGMQDLEWVRTSTMSDNWGSIQVTSPDGTKQLRAHGSVVEGTFELEDSNRAVFDTTTDQELYELPDETFYVQFDDARRPEGCDLDYFSPCGNALTPTAYHPYRATFSPSGDTFAILYRSPSRGNPNRFSVLRVYDANDGRLLNMIGGLSQPVETFAYSPDGRLLLIAFTDGSVRLQEPRGSEPIFGAQHFNTGIAYLAFSSDGDFLLIQRYGPFGPNVLEVRRTNDGALFTKYDSTAFALSPLGTVAIADPDGTIRIRDIDTGARLQSFAGHTNTVYSVAFSPNGQLIASSSEDCTIRLWDANNGTYLHPFEETRVDVYDIGWISRIFVYNLEFLPGTDQLIGFGSWGTAVSWNVNSGATNFRISSEALEYYSGMMTVQPHFPEFFSVDLENDLLYINEVGYGIQTGEMVSEYQSPASLPEGCAPSGPVTPDGQLMFTLGYDDLDGKICVLRAGDLQFVQALTVLPETTYDYGLLWPYLSPDGRQLIVPTTDGVLHVYQVMP